MLLYTIEIHSLDTALVLGFETYSCSGTILKAVASHMTNSLEFLEPSAPFVSQRARNAAEGQFKRKDAKTPEVSVAF